MDGWIYGRKERREKGKTDGGKMVFMTMGSELVKVEIGKYVRFPGSGESIMLENGIIAGA